MVINRQFFVGFSVSCLLFLQLCASEETYVIDVAPISTQYDSLSSSNSDDNFSHEDKPSTSTDDSPREYHSGSSTDENIRRLGKTHLIPFFEDIANFLLDPCLLSDSVSYLGEGILSTDKMPHETRVAFPAELLSRIFYFMLAYSQAENSFVPFTIGPTGKMEGYVLPLRKRAAKKCLTLIKTFRTLSLLCRRSYQNLKIYAIDSVLSGYLGSSLINQDALGSELIRRNVTIHPHNSYAQILSTLLQKGSSITVDNKIRYISFVKNVPYFQGFLDLPTEENNHGIIITSQAPIRLGIRRLYKILQFYVDNELQPKHQYGSCKELISQSSSEQRNRFLGIVKTCCYQQERSQIPPTFLYYLDNAQEYLNNQLNKMKVKKNSFSEILEDYSFDDGKKQIICLFNLLYQINFTYVEKWFSKLVKSVDDLFPGNFAVLRNDFVMQQGDLLELCKDYSVIRAAFFQCLRNKDEKYCSSSEKYYFIKDELLNKRNVSIFIDILWGYLCTLPSHERFAILKSVLNLPDVENKLLNRKIFPMLCLALNKHLKLAQFFENEKVVEELIEIMLEKDPNSICYMPTSQKWLRFNFSAHVKKSMIIILAKAIKKKTILPLAKRKAEDVIEKLK